MKIPDCLNLIRPGAAWSLTNNDYALLEWLDASDKPTLAEIEAAWTQVQATPPPEPEAARYQVREFLMRRGIALDTIPALIASVTTEGIERDVAIMRWQEVPSFPKTHPLVAAVAGELGVNLDEVWGGILAI